MKVYKGKIVGDRIRFPDEVKNKYEKNLGFIIEGRWEEHPNFGHSLGYTSLVVKETRTPEDDRPGYDAYAIETLNSAYTVYLPRGTD